MPFAWLIAIDLDTLSDLNSLNWVLQAALADARAANKAAEARLEEEADSRREFLIKFQERSRAAVGEQQALQRQVSIPTLLGDFRVCVQLKRCSLLSTVFSLIDNS